MKIKHLKIAVSLGTGHARINKRSKLVPSFPAEMKVNRS